MKELRNFVIDLSDIYGRGLPGMIVLLNVYYLIQNSCSTNLLNAFTNPKFTADKLFWAVVAFAVVSFLLGHIPLFLSHQIDRWCRKGIKGFDDPTSAGRIKKYFEGEFDPEFLKKGNTEILAHMMQSLVNSRPDLYEAIRGHEAQRNLRGGTGVSIILFAVVLLFVPVSPQWLFRIASVLVIGGIGSMFLYTGIRSTIECDKMTMRLYYFSKTEPQQPLNDKGKLAGDSHS
jgi:hypothetical protein